MIGCITGPVNGEGENRVYANRAANQSSILFHLIAVQLVEVRRMRVVERHSRVQIGIPQERPGCQWLGNIHP